MSRSLDTTMASGLTAQTVLPVTLATITFGSGPRSCWTGPGPLVWNSVTFLGIGSLGQVSGYQEGTEIEASGVTVQLSGIDPVFLSECLTDIQIGASARIWKGLWQLGPPGSLLGTPYQWFRGQVDKPAFQIGAEHLTIGLSLESRIVNLQRASNRKYTSADQRLRYPDDTSMGWVEQLNDLAVVWG